MTNVARRGIVRRVSVLLEACVDSVESAVAAEQGGAGRLELCANLDVGGTTPDAGLIAAVKAAVAIPVNVIVRPRGGSFVHSAGELARMHRDIDAAKRLGVDGIVVGVLTEHGTIDADRTSELVEAAGTLPITFHKAFDELGDLATALDTLIAVGVTRLLTSGGARTALDGVDAIRSLVERSAGRVIVIAGGSVREHNVAEIVRRTGVGEVHARIEGEARARGIVSRVQQVSP
jgi:copper homeostasis protein